MGARERGRTGRGLSYRETFFAQNGFGPWPCYFCKQMVQADEIVVHHVDKDHGNGDPKNLVAAHNACHLAHHHKREMSPETRAKIGAAHKGRPKSREHIMAMVAARRLNTTYKHTTETRAKISAAVKLARARERAMRESL